jgi:hypothetical protein
MAEAVSTWDPVAADAAAAEFEKEFSALPPATQKSVANLWKKQYMKAGHKKLGRVMLAHADKK